MKKQAQFACTWMQNSADIRYSNYGEVMHDNTTSPIGLYLASYLIVFIELREGQGDDQEKKFLICEDTVIVQADNRQDAYDKVFCEVKRTDFCQGDSGEVSFSWLCEGVTECLPIHDIFRQGCEILYREENSTQLKSLPFTSCDPAHFYTH